MSAVSSDSSFPSTDPFIFDSLYLSPASASPSSVSSVSSSSSSSSSNELKSSSSNSTAPYVDGNYFLVGGEVKKWTGPSAQIRSPIHRQGEKEGIIIGQSPLMKESEAEQAEAAAAKAWGGGRGEWPQLHVSKRIAAVEKFMNGLMEKRSLIVSLLMWEICKSEDDAKKEFDRTIVYMKDTIQELKNMENSQSTFNSTGGIVGQIRRAPLGIVLCLGPFNYPFNETYTTLIPALIMGNVVIMKLPKIGCLCHVPTLEIFAKCFPPGVINVISGSGRATMPHIMQSGKVDLFAFIGTNAGANAMIKSHPAPHRLRMCLGLDAKNPAIILSSADLDVAVSECILGSLSFNGQRCTALKIIFVHESLADRFVSLLSDAIDRLKIGLPWESGVKITPLAEPDKPKYVKDIINDALEKGAKIMNKGGNRFDRSFVSPTVLFPVTPSMRAYREEQFSPVVPITTFRDIDEVYQYLLSSQYGQQASIFGRDSAEIANLVDVLVHQVTRVNINTQCQRGPDNFPFTGRKNSAYGTLSIHDALRVFSIRSLVATKDVQSNTQIVQDIVKKQNSNFLRMDFMF